MITEKGTFHTDDDIGLTANFSLFYATEVGALLIQFILTCRQGRLNEMTPADNIIQSKLHWPGVIESHIHGQRFLEQLTQFSKQLTTLVPPPSGYGKTSPVNCWLQAINNSSACVFPDKDDNAIR